MADHGQSTQDRTTGGRYERLRQLFHAAQPLAAEARAAYLSRHCQDDRLRQEVERLLADSELPTREVLPEPPVFVWEETPDSRIIAGRRSWRLSHEIGRGGLGKVFLAARDAEGFRQLGALKLLRRDRISPQVLARFLDERQILAEMSHPNVARLLDGGTAPDGSPFLVMELIEGLPIDAWCDRRQLSIGERAELFRTVCEAVHAVHKNLVIHCDLKPSNILVSTDGVPKLLDFGIATRAGPDHPEVAAGKLLTPVYASPEQVRGGPLTTATDVYSLGVVLYQLLAGVPPFVSDESSTVDVLQRVLQGSAPPPSLMLEARTAHDGALAEARSATPRDLRRRVRGDLDAIVAKAMATDPVDRYGSARELAYDLRSHLAQRPVSARQPTLPYRLERWARRNRWLAATLVALVTLAAVFVARLDLDRRRIAEQRDRADKVVDGLVGMWESADPFAEDSADLPLREILPKGQEIVSAHLTEEPLVAARLAHELGVGSRKAGLFEESRQLLLQALEIRRQELGESHRDYLRTLGELGVSQYRLGEYDAARESLSFTLAFYQRQLGDTWLTSEALNNLGLVELETDNFDEAERLLEASRAMDRRLGLRIGADTAYVIGNLAELASRRGELQKAAELHREALGLRQQNLPPDHPLIAESLNNLGLVLLHLGDYREAESRMTEVVQILDARLEEDHPVFAVACSNLGSVLLTLEEFEAALQRFQQSVDILGRVLGEDNLNYGISLHNVARALYATGDVQRAVPKIRQALDILRDHLGDEHLRTAQARLYLGEMLIGSDPQEAAEQLERGFAIVDQNTDPDHPVRALALRRLALLHRHQGRPQEAEALLREVPEIRRRAFAPESLEIAEIAVDLGNLLLSRDQPQAAELLLREALEIRRAVLTAETPSLIETERQWRLARTADEGSD